jgi:hypothetical protein
VSAPSRSVSGVMVMSTSGWLYGLLVVAAFSLCGLAVSQSWNAQRLQTQGVTAVARVVRRETSTHRCGTQKHRRTCTDHDLVYSFPTALGQQTVTRDVSRAEYDRTRLGAQRTLRYLPSNPWVWEDAPGDARNGAVATGVAGAVLAGAGALGLSRLHRRVQAMVRVRDTGELRQATVTNHRDTGTRINGAALWVVQWRDEAGDSGEALARFGLTLPAVGQQISVYADPKGVLPSAWEGDVGAPRVGQV